MVQAIQVLRFHLLELEKVSTYNFKYLVLVRRTKWNTFGRKPVGWISRNTTTSRFIGGLDSNRDIDARPVGRHLAFEF